MRGISQWKQQAENQFRSERNEIQEQLPSQSETSQVEGIVREKQESKKEKVSFFSEIKDFKSQIRKDFVFAMNALFNDTSHCFPFHCVSGCQMFPFGIVVEFSSMAQKSFSSCIAWKNTNVS